MLLTEFCMLTLHSYFTWRYFMHMWVKHRIYCIFAFIYAHMYHMTHKMWTIHALHSIGEFCKWCSHDQLIIVVKGGQLEKDFAEIIEANEFQNCLITW